MIDPADAYDKLYRYCFYRVRNAAVAEDLTQETLLKYFSRQEPLQGSEMAYIYTVAKHLCADYFRQAPPAELQEDVADEDFAAQSDTTIAVGEALKKLTVQQREAVLLRYMSGFSVGETAAAMGLSRFAVYRLERAALQTLKKYLKGV